MRWKRLIHFKLRAFLQIQLCCSTRGDVMVKFARHAKDMYVELWKRVPFCNMYLDDKKSFLNLSDSILHCSNTSALLYTLPFKIACHIHNIPICRFQRHWKITWNKKSVTFPTNIIFNICFSMMRSADSKVRNLGKFTNENNHRSC